jgi:carbon storage regulator CsrA
MLVLNRRLQESVVVDHDTVITVLEIGSNFVKLGFDAPGEVSVHRLEKYVEVYGHAPIANPKKKE